jgi:hypothetical protein
MAIRYDIIFLGIVPLGGVRLLNSENKHTRLYYGLGYILNELGKYSKKVEYVKNQIGLGEHKASESAEKWLGRLGIKSETYLYGPGFSPNALDGCELK